MPVDFYPVSADAHVNEPHNLWYERLPADLRDMAPRHIQSNEDGGWELVINGEPLGWSRVSAEKAEQLEAERVAEASPDVRLTMLHEDGLGAEMIYPTIGLYVWSLTDGRVGSAACRAYNDWVWERLGKASARIGLAGMVPTWSVDDAITAVAEIAARGFAALMLPLVGTPDWNHKQWEPLWDAIDETGLPVTMHLASGHNLIPYRGLGSPISNAVANQSMAPRAAALFSTSGVLERHPDLHVVLVEVNGGWLPWLMRTVDEYYITQGDVWGLKPKLAELPSFYVRRQIHATFQDDPVAVANIDLIGPSCLMWGNDYPHPEGTYPHSQDVIERLFADVPEQARRQLLGGNAVDVFNFDPAVSRTPSPSATP